MLLLRSPLLLLAVTVALVAPVAAGAACLPRNAVGAPHTCVVADALPLCTVTPCGSPVRHPLNSVAAPSFAANKCDLPCAKAGTLDLGKVCKAVDYTVTMRASETVLPVVMDFEK